VRWLRLGEEKRTKKEKERRKKKPQEENIMPALLHRAAINGWFLATVTAL